MSHPNTESGTGKGAEHHAVVLRYLYRQESGLEFMGIVVEQLMGFFVFGIKKAKLSHKLTTLAYTE